MTETNTHIHHTPTSLCPSCGNPLDAAGNIDGNGAPNPGDVTLCGKCGEILAFDDALALAPATAERLDQLDPDQVILMHRMQTIIKQKFAHPLKDKPSMTNTIKIDDALNVAWIAEYKAERERLMEAENAYKAEVKARRAAMEAEEKAVHAAFWKKMEEVAPATIDGQWKIDMEYIEQGLVFLKRVEEKPEASDDVPAPIRALMDALGAKLGGKVGVAKITLERDTDKKDDE